MRGVSVKVLWICGIVMNDFTDVFQIKHKPFTGWLESLLPEIEHEADIEIGFCFPIYDETRMRDGMFHRHHVYSFHGKDIADASYRAQMRADFVRAFQDFQPDVVTLWGTEKVLAEEALAACKVLGIVDRLLVRLQAIMATYAEHSLLGIPAQYLEPVNGKNNLLEWQAHIRMMGEQEAQLLQQAKYVCDKSEAGRFYTRRVAPEADFTYCDNILREPFYEYAGMWRLEECTSHEILISQAHTPRKGLHVLLRAMALVRQRYPDVRLRIAGVNIREQYEKACADGGAEGYLAFIFDLLKELDLENRVEFLGMLDAAQMAQAYRSAHVSVTPSLEENKANAICEAMMVGTPTVASFVGGNVDAIHHGVDGLFFPNGDELMLAGFLCKIFADDALATRLSRAATKTALARHDKQKIKETYCELYRKIAREATSTYGKES